MAVVNFITMQSNIISGIKKNKIEFKCNTFKEFAHLNEVLHYSQIIICILF